MALVQPKTYNEVIRFHRCLQLKNYIPEMDEALFNKIFEFINDTNHYVTVSDGLLSFRNRDHSLVDTVNISNTASFNGIELVFLMDKRLSVTRTHTGNSYYDGGSSSNNNNNNNNNNG